MKKTGILNAALICELTKIRHKDKLVICDAGFPIPKDANVVDVSLVAGIPSMLQVLKAVLNEIIVEDYTIFDKMKEANPEYYDFVTGIFQVQEHHEADMDGFIAQAQAAKLFIRTGELRPCSNIMLTSATGVRSRCDAMDICFDEIG